MGYEEERDRSGHRRSRRAKPSEMEDDGLTLITDSFTERREDGSHRSGESGKEGTDAAWQQPGEPESGESPDHEPVGYLRRSG